MFKRIQRNLKRLDLIDIKLLQLVAVCFAFILAMIFPVLLKVNPWGYAVLAVILSIRPVMKILG